MKKAVCSLILLGSLTLCMALSSVTLSPVFTIDTALPEIDINSPTPGQVLYIGDTHDIEWIATDTNLEEDTIDILYSLNGGSTYIPFATSIFNSGMIVWEIPAQQSSSAKIRITALDSFGNQGIKESANFTISYVPPAIPTGVNVDILENTHAQINWEAVTHTIEPYNTPITPDGYIILYNESPYEEDEHFYYFLARSYGTSYTHQDVAEFRDQMFYRVLAYKNYRGEDNDALQLLIERSKTQKIPWTEAKQILGGAR
ncbi:MAG: hypothetical protein WCY64_06670 [Candidatus Cloacimonadaceae bacterium]